MVVGSCLSVLFGWFDYTKERIEYNLKPVVKIFYLYIDVNDNSRLWNKYEMRVLLHGACKCVSVCFYVITLPSPAVGQDFRL